MSEQLTMFGFKDKTQDFVDWEVDQRNKEWHQHFLTQKAVSDHQAKGNMTFCRLILDYMESQDWLHKGDVIFDPMCGVGSFLLVSALKGYNAIGVELEEIYYKDILEGILPKFEWKTKDLKSIGSILVKQGDSRKLHEMEWLARILGKTPKVVCSPPYGNTLKDDTQQVTGKKGNWEDWGKSQAQYSGSEENIGNSKIRVLCSPPYSKQTELDKRRIDSFKIFKTGYTVPPYSEDNIAVLDIEAEYPREMLKVYKSLYRVMPPGTIVALITRNFIQDFKVVELDQLTIDLMEQAGFGYIRTKRARLPELGFLKRVNWKKYHKDKGLPLIDWEEVTFYVKEIL